MFVNCQQMVLSVMQLQQFSLIYANEVHEYITAAQEYMTATLTVRKRRGNGCYLQAGERAA